MKWICIQFDAFMPYSTEDFFLLNVQWGLVSFISFLGLVGAWCPLSSSDQVFPLVLLVLCLDWLGLCFLNSSQIGHSMQIRFLFRYILSLNSNSSSCSETDFVPSFMNCSIKWCDISPYFQVAALLTLVFVIVVNLALGILPRVDNFAHIGGLISGFFLGFVVFIRPQFAWLDQQRVAPGQQIARAERKHKTYQYVLWIVAAVMLIIGWAHIHFSSGSIGYVTFTCFPSDDTCPLELLYRFTVAIVMLFRGYNANDHCSWCQYMSCVPTKKWKCNSSPTTCSVS